MKFSIFVHMERLHSALPFTQLYQDFLDLCIMADKANMHCIWVGEHHGMNFTIAPNPFLNLVDLSNKTKNVRLGTGTVVAPFWHPIKLAGEAAMTDIICDGRLELGVARGAYSFEYERLLPGLDAWTAGQKMREVVPAVQRLWKGDYEHKGKFYEFPSSTSSPKPLQQGGPSMWIAARDSDSFVFALQNHCHVQVAPLWLGVEEIENLKNKHRQSLIDYPDLPANKIMLLHHLYVTESEQESIRIAKKLSEFFCYFGSWFANKKPVSQAMMEELTEEDYEQMPQFSPEKIRKNLIIGSAKEVTERLKYYQELGFDEFAIWIDASTLTAQEKRLSLSRFIEQVMPTFT